MTEQAARPELERIQKHASGEDFNACSCWQCPEVGKDVDELVTYALSLETALAERDGRIGELATYIRMIATHTAHCPARTRTSAGPISEHEFGPCTCGLAENLAALAKLGDAP